MPKNNSSFMKWWNGVKDIPAIYKYEHAQSAWNAAIHLMTNILQDASHTPGGDSEAALNFAKGFNHARRYYTELIKQEKEKS